MNAKTVIQWAWGGTIIGSLFLIASQLPYLSIAEPRFENYLVAVFGFALLVFGTFFGFFFYPEIDPPPLEPIDPNCLTIEFEEFRILRNQMRGVSEVRMNTWIRYTNSECGQDTTVTGWKFLKPNGKEDFSHVFTLRVPVNDSPRRRYDIPIGRNRTKLCGTLVVEHVLGQSEIPVDISWLLDHKEGVLYP